MYLIRDPVITRGSFLFSFAADQQSQSVSIPAGLLLQSGSVVVLIEYAGDDLFVQTTNQSHQSVVSSVISVDIAGVPSGVKLAENITIVFDVTVVPHVKYVCAYWSFVLRQWRQDGCYFNNQSSNQNQIVCQCEHLTNFAVLADVGGKSSDSQLSSADRIALNYLTWIGCGISIAGLAITILTFLFFPVSCA